MSGPEPGYLIPNEPQIMSAMVSDIITVIRAAATAQNIPMPVAVNATASALARVSMLAILTYPEEVRGGSDFEREAFKRILDAVASMEDWKDRKTPWRMQSSSLKQAEREGFAVREISDDKATKQ